MFIYDEFDMLIGGNYVKKKAILFIFIIGILFLLMWGLILPVINWNRSYNVSNLDSAQKSVEYYLDAINDRNPKKALTIYPKLNDSEPKLGMFSLLSVTSCDIKNIKPNKSNTSNDEYEVYADFYIGFIPGFIPECFEGLITESQEVSLIFKVKFDANAHTYKIIDSYTNV